MTTNWQDIAPEESTAVDLQESQGSLGSVPIITLDGCGSSGSAGNLSGELCCHCTREENVSAMINSGSKQAPRYRCKPCHAAVRFLERAAKSKSDTHYQRFCETRRTSPLKFSELVLQCRMSPEGEAPLPEHEDLQRGLAKCTDHNERRERATSMMDTVFSVKGTEDYDDVHFLTERQFKAHMKNHEDMSAAEAQAAWDTANIGKETEKRYVNGQVQIAVLACSGRRSFKQKGSKRELQREEALSDEDLEGEANMKRMRPHSAGTAGEGFTHADAELVSKA
eukprot:6469375-Amphidinium_carterae.1